MVLINKIIGIFLHIFIFLSLGIATFRPIGRSESVSRSKDNIILRELEKGKTHTVRLFNGTIYQKEDDGPRKGAINRLLRSCCVDLAAD